MNSLCELSFVFVSVFWIIYVSPLRNSLCEFSFDFLYYLWEFSYEFSLWVLSGVRFFVNSLCELSYEFSLWILFCVCLFFENSVRVIFSVAFVLVFSNHLCWFSYELAFLFVSSLMNSLCELSVVFFGEFCYEFSLWVRFCVSFDWIIFVCSLMIFGCELYFVFVLFLNSLWVLLWIIFVSSILCSSCFIRIILVKNMKICCVRFIFALSLWVISWIIFVHSRLCFYFLNYLCDSLMNYLWELSSVLVCFWIRFVIKLKYVFELSSWVLLLIFFVSSHLFLCLFLWVILWIILVNYILCLLFEFSLWGLL